MYREHCGVVMIERIESENDQKANHLINIRVVEKC